MGARGTRSAATFSPTALGRGRVVPGSVLTHSNRWGPGDGALSAPTYAQVLGVRIWADCG